MGARQLNVGFAAPKALARSEKQDRRQATVRRLRLALFLTILILLVEASGGLFSHSLALLADAGHVLTDIFALALAWFAAVQALRPADAERTYGYHRIGILAALANATALVVIAIFIGFEAYHRLLSVHQVSSGPMLAAAMFGLGVNLFVTRELIGGESRNLNVRSALLHVLGDAAASAGVIAAAIVIARTQFYQLDPIVSLLVALLICLGAWRIIVDTLRILMESAPAGLDLTEVVRQIGLVPGIKDVHDLHVWSISSEMIALSCHVLMEDQPASRISRTLERVKGMLRERFAVDHSTIEVECEGCETETPFCSQQPGGTSEPAAVNQ